MSALGVSTVFDWVPHVPAAMDLVIAVGGVIVAIGLVYKFVFCPLRSQYLKFNRAADTMLGYPEVRDPGTGRVIQKATPALGTRVYELESAAIRMADAMESIAETQRETLALTQRMGELQVKFETHEQESHARWLEHEQWSQTWISEHEALHTIVAETRPVENEGEK